ncbi:tRNA-guanine transglycosylase family protein [Sclerotinia borealis F-4128]|uniref:Queuine tRNA-ribosyltransferase accessory subunit 2 n=1 Tax=Sclerotinia borealis (strain F-4128) TaxID=1432307 RepID=W9CHJ8_SCLBF|nr:tRNA-guanine transglycosylase family protein [Sclerotinia borealis F-4128]
MAPKNTTRLGFQILSTLDHNTFGPRLGRLSVEGRKDLETPDFIAITSRGVIPHMTPDVIAAHARVPGVHFALEDFIEKSNKTTISPILKYPGPEPPLHAFTSLSRSTISLLAPRRTPAITAPSGNGNTAISVFTSTGFQPLSNKSYIDSIETLRPDIAIALADVPYSTIAGAKRTAKMGDRSGQWLAQLLSDKFKDQPVFAPVLPIDYQSQWEYINYISDELVDEISGLAFYDSNLLPDIPETTTMSSLPRLSLDEPSSPHHVLRQISLGMDIFTIPFINFATDAGIALSFEFPSPTTSQSQSPSSNEGSSVLSLGIDMWTPAHSCSLLPLSTSCKCYACTSHHRAFIQHLLSAKEMLGWVLIQVHNHHVLSEFFTSIRHSIKEGTFEEDCKEFARIYDSELPEKSGQGPRIRGYQYKSEKAGERKKNKVAWNNLGPDSTGTGSEVTLVPDENSKELEDKGFAEKLEN